MNAIASFRAHVDPLSTLEFFDRTLADRGLIVIALKSSARPGMRHEFLASKEDAADFVAQADRNGVDVYHAIGTYADKALGRVAENAVAFQSLVADVDAGPGKPYESASSAVLATKAFCRAAGVPLPLIVASGRGIHLYWPMDAAMSPGQYLAVATLLKGACAKQGFHVDPSRATDRASLLRPPGSTNRKGDPVPVQVLRDCAQMPLAAFQGALEAYLGFEVEAPEVDTLGARPAHIRGAADNSDLGGPTEYPPSFADRVADNCAVMGMIRDTRGVTDQGTWYHSHQLLNKCVDGWDYAHEWSKGDPRYSRAEVERNRARLEGRGPTLCSKFADLQPALCGACPHFGKIKSPISLGVEPAPLPSTIGMAFTAPAVGVEASRAVNLLGQTYKRQFELGDWLIIGELTAINAPGAVGKTTLIMLMAVSLASGIDLMGLEIFLARSVLILNFEEVVAEQILKLRATCDHHRVPASAIQNLHIFGSDTAPDVAMTIISPTTRQAQINPAWFAWLRQTIVDRSAQVVFIDPWSALMLHGMNDNGLTYAVVRALKAIAAECGCAIVVAAHTRKGGQGQSDGVDEVMGAAALTNGARVVLGMRRLDEATAKAVGADYGEEGDLREIINQKANFTPVGRGKYFKFVGVLMNNAAPPYRDGDWVAVAERYLPRVGSRSLPLAAMKDAAIQLARGAMGGAEPYCQKKGVDRWFGDDVVAAIKPHMPSLGQRALEAAAKELVVEGLAGGWIVTQPFKNAHRKLATGLAVVWAATDWAGDPAPAGTYMI